MLPLKLKSRSSEEGFTLIESLVAIAIIGIILAAIGPPILLATATRLYNQRTEQAVQLAQGEVDRVRLIVERDYITTDLPPASSTTQIQDTPAPNTGALGYTSDRSATTVNKGFAFDVNGDATPDFVVQTFRNSGVMETQSDGTSIPVAFNMGVRVYDFQGFAQNARLNIEPPSLRFTAGRNLQTPLAVIYTPIVRADRSLSLDKYRQLLTP